MNSLTSLGSSSRGQEHVHGQQGVSLTSLGSSSRGQEDVHGQQGGGVTAKSYLCQLGQEISWSSSVRTKLLV